MEYRRARRSEFNHRRRPRKYDFAQQFLRNNRWWLWKPSLGHKYGHCRGRCKLNIRLLGDAERWQAEFYSCVLGLTLSGGEQNSIGAGADHAVIGGGYANQTSGGSSVIGGGDVNNVSGLWATVGGGWGNTIMTDYSTVGGGDC